MLALLISLLAAALNGLFPPQRLGLGRDGYQERCCKQF